MVARRPEQLCAAVGALEVQLDVVLPCDRDAAVHLDGFGGHVANASLAATRASAADVGRGFGDSVVDDRAGGLHLDVEVGHPVLERLEATDRPAELDAVLGVGDGEVEAAARRTDLLDCQQDCRGVGQPGIGAEVRRWPAAPGGPAAGWGPSTSPGVRVNSVQRVSLPSAAATTTSATSPLTT